MTSGYPKTNKNPNYLLNLIELIVIDLQISLSPPIYKLPVIMFRNQCIYNPVASPDFRKQIIMN